MEKTREPKQLYCEFFCCRIRSKIRARALVVSRRADLKCKGKGRSTVHFNGSDETIEVILRTVFPSISSVSTEQGATELGPGRLGPAFVTELGPSELGPSELGPGRLRPGLKIPT